MSHYVLHLVTQPQEEDANKMYVQCVHSSRDSYSKVKAKFWRAKTLTAVADLPTVSAYVSPP